MNTNPASDLGRVGLVVGGKFRLDAIIGRGGMGSVWSATHVSLGHKLAIKLVAREFIRSAEALRRFDAEAKAAARLQSRHVVQVFDNGTLDDGTPYIAMELLSGENLEQRIQRLGRVSLPETAAILAQCGKALTRAHAAGIVHRDIKPDNIFLSRSPDDDADVVKILDFGVAKMTMALGSASGATGTGAVLGTPLYMSPEQVRGLKEIDHRSDLYSLGIVAFTMLTGSTAIVGETFGEIVIRICTEPLPSLRVAAPWLPAAVEGWFLRACAREASGRFNSAQELVEALRAAAGESSAALRVTPTPATPPMSVQGTLASQGLPAPAPSVAAVSPPPVHAATLGEQSAASVSVVAGVPRRSSGALIAGSLLVALFAIGGLGVFAMLPHRPDPPAASATTTASPPLSPAASGPSTAPSAVVGLSPLVEDAGPAAAPPGANPVHPSPPPAPSAVPREPVGAARPLSSTPTAPPAPNWPPPRPAYSVATPPRPPPAPSPPNPPKPRVNLGY